MANQKYKDLIQFLTTEDLSEFITEEDLMKLKCDVFKEQVLILVKAFAMKEINQRTWSVEREIVIEKENDKNKSKEKSNDINKKKNNFLTEIDIIKLDKVINSLDYAKNEFYTKVSLYTDINSDQYKNHIDYSDCNFSDVSWFVFMYKKLYPQIKMLRIPDGRKNYNLPLTWFEPDFWHYDAFDSDEYFDSDEEIIKVSESYDSDDFDDYVKLKLSNLADFYFYYEDDELKMKKYPQNSNFNSIYERIFQSFAAIIFLFLGPIFWPTEIASNNITNKTRMVNAASNSTLTETLLNNIQELLKIEVEEDVTHLLETRLDFIESFAQLCINSVTISKDVTRELFEMSEILHNFSNCGKNTAISCLELVMDIARQDLTNHIIESSKNGNWSNFASTSLSINPKKNALILSTGPSSRNITASASPTTNNVRQNDGEDRMYDPFTQKRLQAPRKPTKISQMRTLPELEEINKPARGQRTESVRKKQLLKKKLLKKKLLKKKLLAESLRHQKWGEMARRSGLDALFERIKACKADPTLNYPNFVYEAGWGTKQTVGQFDKYSACATVFGINDLSLNKDQVVQVAHFRQMLSQMVHNNHQGLDITDERKQFHSLLLTGLQNLDRLNSEKALMIELAFPDNYLEVAQLGTLEQKIDFLNKRKPTNELAQSLDNFAHTVLKFNPDINLKTLGRYVSCYTLTTEDNVEVGFKMSSFYKKINAINSIQNCTFNRSYANFAADEPVGNPEETSPGTGKKVKKKKHQYVGKLGRTFKFKNNKGRTKTVKKSWYKAGVLNANEPTKKDIKLKDAKKQKQKQIIAKVLTPDERKKANNAKLKRNYKLLNDRFRIPDEIKVLSVHRVTSKALPADVALIAEKIVKFLFYPMAEYISGLSGGKECYHADLLNPREMVRAQQVSEKVLLRDSNFHTKTVAELGIEVREILKKKGTPLRVPQTIIQPREETRTFQK